MIAYGRKKKFLSVFSIQELSELIDGCKSRNENAWAALYSLYRRKILGLAHKWGFRNEDAEDILQETFLRLDKVMDRMKAEGFSSYLFRVAASACIDGLRRRRNLKRGEGSLVRSLDELVEAGFEPAVKSDVEFDDAMELKMRVLSECIDGLSSKDRELILDRYLHGKELEEMAKARNSRTNTLAVKIHRILVRIRAEARTKLDVFG